MSYGALNSADIGVLEGVLSHYHGRSLRFLEIGLHTGQTARGIKEYCDTHGIALDYWGMDNGIQNDGQPPFPGANMIIGDSALVFHLAPDVIDVVMVDGAHTRNHVILDTANYSCRVPPGGFILFHDTSPEIQHTMRDSYGPDIPQFYNAVNEGLLLIEWPWKGWKLAGSGYVPGCAFGGTTAWRKDA